MKVSIYAPYAKNISTQRGTIEFCIPNELSATWNIRYVSVSPAFNLRETDLRTELVPAAINMALVQRRPDGGWVTIIPITAANTRASPPGKHCREMGVMPSVGLVGDAYDGFVDEVKELAGEKIGRQLDATIVANARVTMAAIGCHNDDYEDD